MLSWKDIRDDCIHLRGKCLVELQRKISTLISTKCQIQWKICKIEEYNLKILTCLWLQVGVRVERQSMRPSCRTNRSEEVKESCREHGAFIFRRSDLDYSSAQPRTSLIYPQGSSITIWSIHYHHTQSPS